MLRCTPHPDSFLQLVLLFCAVLLWYSLFMGKDSIDKTQEEIVEEIAKALGHSGDLLEDVLEKLSMLEKKMDLIEDTDKFNRLVDEFNELRKKALARRDMLMIHREAIGVRKHGYLDAFYPIPGKKKRRQEEEGD